MNSCTYKAKLHQTSTKQLEKYDCVLRLRSAVRVIHTGRVISTAATKKPGLQHLLNRAIYTVQRRVSCRHFKA